MATPRPLLAFAYVADSFSKTGDISDGLLKLLAPVIAKRSGTRFYPEEFAADVYETYDIEMHPYVAEDFAPRLAAAGYLIETVHIDQRVIYQNGEFDLPEPPVSPQALEALLDRFADGASKLLAENDLEIPRETLKSGFLDRLVQPDFLGLIVRPDRPSGGPRTMSLKRDSQTNVAPEIAERLHLDYLSARFILECNSSNPEDFELLVGISSGALATEVVLSLQHPPGLGDDFLDVQVALDGPLILDALGLGQDGPVQYAKLLIEAIKRAKAQPVVFQHTIEEVEGAIRTPLENFERHQEVHGPLGRKLLKNSAYAPYIRSILGKLSSLIENLGIRSVPFSDGDRARLRTIFTESNEDRLSDSIGTYNTAESKLRDARSVANVLRIRGAAEASSIRNCEFVFVTRNSRLARLSRKFLIQESLIARDYFPPCVTDRYLAGLLWITQGGGGSQLSRERLIANCTAAVMPRRDVITKMYKFLSGVNHEMATRFEALMTNERAEHFLMDRTIADVDLITDENLEQIYRDVELVAGERITAEKDAEIAGLKSSHAIEVEAVRRSYDLALNDANERSAENLRRETVRAIELEAQMREEKRRADEAADRVEQLRLNEVNRVNSLLEICMADGRRALKRAEIRIGASMLVIAIMLGMATQFLPALTTSKNYGLYLAVSLILLSAIFSVLNYLKFPDFALVRYARRCRDEAAFRRARELGVEEALKLRVSQTEREN